MSDGDIFTDNNRSFSPSSQDTSSLDSIPSTTKTPRRNPYIQQNQSQRYKLTAQCIYTATNQKSQQTITRWLISDNSTQPPNTVPNKKKSLPMTKLRTKRQPQCTIQTPLHQLLANDHWGDAPSTNPMSFRVISKNVNSLLTKEHNLQWRGAVHAMQEMDAHVLCIQEPNLYWHAGILQPIYKIFQKAFMHAKMTTSNSTAPNTGNHQPSGTFLATTGCYAACVTTTGTDPTSMGRWLYHELLGKHHNRYLIITAYRVGPQQPTIGTNTAYTQQYNIMLSAHHLNPDPHEQFVTDIIEFVC